MPDQRSADFELLVSRTSVDDAVRRALALFVGRGRRYSVKQLSNATGVKDRAIECAMAEPGTTEHRSLNLGALLSIAGFIGPAFTNEWLRLADMVAMRIPEAAPDPAETSIGAADSAAIIVRAAADGRFDDQEIPELRVVGARLMETGATLAGMRN